MRLARPALCGLALLAVLALLIPALRSARADGATILGDAKPGILTDPDRVWVELGVRFTSSSDGTITGLRFYKSPSNTGSHVGTLWTGSGRKLATLRFTDETASGWQTARFADPVAISRGRDYVASYSAPAGGYSADSHGFDHAVRSGSLTVPAGGGVYNYEHGGFPVNNWQNSNYYVDVVFSGSGNNPNNPDEPGQPSASSIGTATSTSVASPSSTASATSAAPTSSSASASATSAPSASSSTPAGGSDGDDTSLDLPRIPWEGGSAYWKQFSKADQAGWSNPNFFPIALWWGGLSSDAEAQYDKSVGLNSYVQLNPATPYKLLGDNGMYWIGGKLNDSFNDQSKNWVGSFLDDETDGRFTPAEGRAHLQELSDQAKNTGRFRYANFTSMIATYDMKPSDAEAYVNNYTDAASIDQYFYSVPQCDWTPYRDPYIVPISQTNCRTSSSYGKIVKMLRQRDATDGKLQSPWQFVENMSPEGTNQGFHAINGNQIRGAVVNSLINEARGIVYFNQSFSGTCSSGNIVRSSQVIPNFCGADQVNAMKTVNLQIKQLAPVLNTQSYDYSFGSGLNTMLKAKDGSVYVFAMIDGSSKPGDRSFKLPAGVSGSKAEVMFENRSIDINNGAFNDNFAQEYSYHIYKISK